jgi:hypothetical protein
MRLQRTGGIWLTHEPVSISEITGKGHNDVSSPPIAGLLPVSSLEVGILPEVFKEAPSIGPVLLNIPVTIVNTV